MESNYMEVAKSWLSDSFDADTRERVKELAKIRDLTVLSCKMSVNSICYGCDHEHQCCNKIMRRDLPVEKQDKDRHQKHPRKRQLIRCIQRAVTSPIKS